MSTPHLLNSQMNFQTLDQASVTIEVLNETCVQAETLAEKAIQLAVSEQWRQAAQLFAKALYLVELPAMTQRCSRVRTLRAKILEGIAALSEYSAARSVLAGDYDFIVDVPYPVENDSFMAKVLALVVDQFAAKGRRDCTFRVLKAIVAERQSFKTKVLVKVARKFLASEQDTQALKVITMITDGWEKTKILSEIVSQSVTRESGKAKELLQTAWTLAQTVERESAKNYLLEKIAASAANVGLYDLA